MAAQEGVMSPYNKFGIDTSMHHRDMASPPVWRRHHQVWLAATGKRKHNKKIHTIIFVWLGLKIQCVKSRGNQTICVTWNAFWRFLLKFKMAENLIGRTHWTRHDTRLPTVHHLWNLDQRVQGCTAECTSNFAVLVALQSSVFAHENSWRWLWHCPEYECQFSKLFTVAF